MDGDDPTHEPARLTRSRPVAFAAFLLTLTSLLLAWWRVTWDAGGPSVPDDVRPFRPEPPLTTEWGPWLTGGLVVVAAMLLFVRIAARSERHEPPLWRRDLAVAAVLLAAALASALLWPAEVPSFWGGRTYTDNLTDGEPTTEVASPGLGWWTALVAMLLLLLARRLARPPRANQAPDSGVARLPGT